MPSKPGRVREPMFNAPWPATALVVALVLAFLAQSYLMSGQAAGSLALSGPDLRQGHWFTLLTYQFIHAGWGHILMNAAAAFAFGPPIARLFGSGVGGAVLFYGFFLICGTLAGLGWLALHMNSAAGLAGASGAISGLWGAASRLMGWRGGLAPIFSRPVLSQAIAFAAINLIIGLLGPLVGFPIGWEAHVTGYVAGLLLIGPALRIAIRHG